MPVVSVLSAHRVRAPPRERDRDRPGVRGDARVQQRDDGRLEIPVEVEPQRNTPRRSGQTAAVAVMMLSESTRRRQIVRREEGKKKHRACRGKFVPLDGRRDERRAGVARRRGPAPGKHLDVDAAVSAAEGGAACDIHGKRRRAREIIRREAIRRETTRGARDDTADGGAASPRRLRRARRHAAPAVRPREGGDRREAAAVARRAAAEERAHEALLRLAQHRDVRGAVVAARAMARARGRAGGLHSSNGQPEAVTSRPLRRATRRRGGRSEHAADPPRAPVGVWILARPSAVVARPHTPRRPGRRRPRLGDRDVRRSAAEGALVAQRARRARCAVAVGEVRDDPPGALAHRQRRVRRQRGARGAEDRVGERRASTKQKNKEVCGDGIVNRRLRRSTASVARTDAGVEGEARRTAISARNDKRSIETTREPRTRRNAVS